VAAIWPYLRVSVGRLTNKTRYAGKGVKIRKNKFDRVGVSSVSEERYP